MGSNLVRPLVPSQKGCCIRVNVTLPVLFVTVVCFLVSAPVLSAQTLTEKKASATLAELNRSLQDLSERVGPAVVQIMTTGYGSIEGTNLSSAGLVVTQRRNGSGVILDSDGYIVTNAHVVKGARRIQVLLAVLPDERAQWRSILKPRGKLVSARIVGIDSETDLAVLKIEEKGLTFLELGDSDQLRQGQLVVAFGSPFGLGNSVTMGVVSSVARQLRPGDPMIYIQTDASINPGNSGGPLVDTEGRVVGINTFILSQSGGSEGIGFAAPSNIVRNVFRQIRKTGRVRRGQINVQAQTITPVLAAGLGLPQNWGVVLADVFPRGAADAAGLEIGDIVLSLDGKVMENARQFEVNLYRRPVGDVVTLEVLRESERFTKQVRVQERPKDFDRLVDSVVQESSLIARFGILCVDLDARIRKMLPPLRELSGVVVTARTADGPSHRYTFHAGDVIYSINRVPTTSLADLRSVVVNLNVGDPVVVQIERLGKLMFVVFELE